MRMSISVLQAKMWMRMLAAICLCLLLELGLCGLAMMVLHRTSSDLVRPYCAFALPVLIFLPLAWWLRIWEKRGASPRQLASCWTCLMIILASMVIAAFFYSGVELRLTDQRNALGAFTLVELLLIPTAIFTVYQQVLKTTSARTARGQYGTSE